MEGVFALRHTVGSLSGGTRVVVREKKSRGVRVVETEALQVPVKTYSRVDEKGAQVHLIEYGDPEPCSFAVHESSLVKLRRRNR